MNTPFELQPYDLNAIGRNGGGTVKVLVNGYWSGDCLTLYVQREFRFQAAEGATFNWKLSFSHSSGGRETSPAKERGVASDLEAAVNFGAAMIALSAVGRTIEARFAELEAAYLARRAEDKAQAEVEAQEKAARVAADPAYGQEQALGMIEASIRNAKVQPENQGVEIEISARPRGESETPYNTHKVLISRKRWQQKITVRYNGTVVSKHDAAAKLGQLSAATVGIIAR